MAPITVSTQVDLPGVKPAFGVWQQTHPAMVTLPRGRTPEPADRVRLGLRSPKTARRSLHVGSAPPTPCSSPSAVGPIVGPNAAVPLLTRLAAVDSDRL